MSTVHREHSIWLLPAEPLRQQLRGIIQNLATKFNAVDFEPHVTLSCGVSSDGECKTVAAKIASEFAPVTLAMQKIDYSALYTKTLFVQFAESAEARHMVDTIGTLDPRATTYVFNPHLSLLYKTIPVAVQNEIARTLDVPKTPYLFDKLRIIETKIPLTEPQQIKAWRVVGEVDLAR